MSESEGARKEIERIEKELLLKRKLLTDRIKDQKSEALTKQKEKLKMEALENQVYAFQRESSS